MVNVLTITQAILDMQDELKVITDFETGKQMQAEKLAKIIYDAITSAEVLPGITVTTAGSATAQAGVTTSTGTLQ
jgi:hypothetical protein